jgi:hypothetical protein
MVCNLICFVEEIFLYYVYFFLQVFWPLNERFSLDLISFPSLNSSLEFCKLFWSSILLMLSFRIFISTLQIESCLKSIVEKNDKWIDELNIDIDFIQDLIENNEKSKEMSFHLCNQLQNVV